MAFFSTVSLTTQQEKGYLPIIQYETVTNSNGATMKMGVWKKKKKREGNFVSHLKLGRVVFNLSSVLHLYEVLTPWYGV